MSFIFSRLPEEKDFDVFLSHAWSPQPAHRAEGLNFISTSGLYSEAEGLALQAFDLQPK